MALALVTLTIAAACGTKGGAGSAVTAGAPRSLDGNELRYGASPRAHGPIVYQPDVIVVRGGASAVNSVSADGLVWTLDGNAADARTLQVGKVPFVTSFGAGRILDVEPVGSNVRVALGPVALTDIIRDGTFGTAAPIPLTGFDAYQTPAQPGAQTDPDAPGQQTATQAAARAAPVRLAAFVANPPLTPPSVPTPPTPALPSLPPPAPKVPDSVIGNWNVASVCCTSIGLHVAYDKGGARVQGTATLKFDNPTVTFDVRIRGGQLVNASAHLNGAAAISFSLSAAVQASAADFRGGRIQVPVDIVIPVPAGNIPLNIGIQQLFSISLGLSGQAFMATTGEYALAGRLGFTVSNGTPQADRPTLTTTKSALDAMQSLAAAPQAMEFAYAVKLSVGVGPPGLSAGIWYQVAASLALAASGARLDPLQGTSLVTCKAVNLSVQGKYGVGYDIPTLVASAINLFLRTVLQHPPPPIAPIGGPSWGPTTLYAKSTPPCSK